jgi:hypothetical protein
MMNHAEEAGAQHWWSTAVAAGKGVLTGGKGVLTGGMEAVTQAQKAMAAQVAKSAQGSRPLFEQQSLEASLEARGSGRGIDDPSHKKSPRNHLQAPTPSRPS